MPGTTKIDYKRELRELYAPRGNPVIVDVPELAYLMIDGHGDPNTAAEFSDAIEALYTVAYAAKFAVKRAPDGVDYGVMPLEGLFWAPDMSAFTTEDKSAWDWTLMIMQPDHVTDEVFGEAHRLPALKEHPDRSENVRLAYAWPTHQSTNLTRREANRARRAKPGDAHLTDSKPRTSHGRTLDEGLPITARDPPADGGRAPRRSAEAPRCHRLETAAGRLRPPVRRRDR